MPYDIHDSSLLRRCEYLETKPHRRYFVGGSCANGGGSHEPPSPSRLQSPCPSSSRPAPVQRPSSARFRTSVPITGQKANGNRQSPSNTSTITVHQCLTQCKPAPSLAATGAPFELANWLSAMRLHSALIFSECPKALFVT